MAITREVSQMDMINLAFLGDAVYELMIRKSVIHLNRRVEDLHLIVIDHVSARAQSRDLHLIEELLTDEEKSIVRRARNKHLKAPKNCSPRDYARATGLEALIGALYLSEDIERLKYLFDQILKRRGDDFGYNRNQSS
ncbi:MAG: ribonuclease III domain-containing protein [Ezakiella sp.]|nr:Mini-ribonuclease 3 [Ezakiella sp.]MDD7762190.1 ribonuclease III domain-containing protein [Bacillota bacterium]MDY3946405.1 ribonuclease III domain-containing protein [Ezakiella sp.]